MNSLQKLNRGEVLNLEGLNFIKDTGEIKPGDFYIAERNTGPKFLEAKEIKDGYIVPTSLDYPFDVWECVKVKEV